MTSHRIAGRSIATVSMACAAAMLLLSAGPVGAADEQIITIEPAVPVDQTVDPRSRANVMDSLAHVLSLEDVPSGWSGDTSTCNAGDTTAEFKQAVLDTVNWYRNMVGLPDATLSAEYNRMAQKAALMMAAADSLSHSPSPDWPCWSEEGRIGAGNSNLFLGSQGPRAVHGYVNDPGGNNAYVGHRWWVLRPGVQTFGTGDTNWSNALFVTGNPLPGAEPAVAWPKPGYFPAEVLPSSGRWSFFPARGTGPDDSLDWDMTDSNVSVVGPGGSVPLASTTASRDLLVWEMPPEIYSPRVDSTYDVQITGAVNSLGQTATFRYQVVLIPGDLPDTRITSGPGDALAAGEAELTFEPDDLDAECRLDGEPWEVCYSPQTYWGLGAGRHVFEVRTENRWGWDPTPATLEFTVPQRPTTTKGRITVKARGVAKSSKLRLDVDPDRARGGYGVKIQRHAKGSWKTARKVRTKGPRELRVVNLPRGTYRVVVPAQSGLLGARSGKVRLVR